MSVLDPRVRQPRWGDFALTAGESEAPEMWDGVTGIYVPLMGPTGNFLADLSYYQNHGALQNMDPPNDWSPTPHGFGIEFRNTLNERVEIPAVGTIGYNDSNECSVVAKFTIDTSGDHGVFEQTSDSIVNTGFSMFNTGTAVTWRTRLATGGIVSINFTGTYPFTSIIVGTLRPTRMELYQDGISRANTTFASDAFNAGVDDIALIGHLASSLFPMDGIIEYVIVLNRELSSKEVAGPWLDPMAMLRRRKRTIGGFVPAAIAAGLFRSNPSPDGLGGGGPFFKDPLAA